MTTLPPPPADLVLPHLGDGPLPHHTHPDLAGAEAAALGWPARWGVFPPGGAPADYAAAQWGLLTAVTYPAARDIGLAAGWYAWTWVTDDPLDDPAAPVESRRELAGALLAQFTPDPPGPPPTHPACQATAELWLRTCRGMSRAWRERIRGHLRDYLAATLAKPGPGEQPSGSVATFMRRRRMHSLVEVVLDLFEPLHGYELALPVAESDLYRAARAAVNDATSWVNDVHSAAKEARRGEYESLPGVLLAAEGFGWQAALEMAAELARAAVAEYPAAAQDVRDARWLFALPEPQWAVVERHLDDLGRWIDGQLHWYRATGLYALANGVAHP